MDTHAALRESEKQELRDRLLEHLAALNLPTDSNRPDLKDSLGHKHLIRQSHDAQRRQRNHIELLALRQRIPRLLDYFASGDEICPKRIEPSLELVDSERESGSLFRLATTLWSVPVSRGFGRRIRFNVVDKQNGKLIGVLALGDPVFNLRARDNWIGWTARDREERLVHVMDAYVVGAIPPYSELLGGKLVASLIASDEVSRIFSEKYSGSVGHISEREKNPQLTLVTITSALGRSSIYNRLRLNGMLNLQRLGFTEGWGHFQISDVTFEAIRSLLSAEGHPYADGYKFGMGPNWRIRVIREGLRVLGLDTNLLRHGIRREVFAMALAENWQEFLLGQDLTRRPSSVPVSMIADAALHRWVIPRAERQPGFRNWRREDTLALLEAGIVTDK